MFQGEYTIIQKAAHTIDFYGMLQNGDNVICAVSGGADSVCLLYVMIHLKEKYNLKLYCANVNHKIRPGEAERDSLFVKKLCERENIELFYREFDVPALAKERRIGEEECGRQVRYDFFSELSAKIGNAKIATAHNMGDNAETILFRLARGTSGKGMCGIPPMRGNIIRPLLFVTRKEIEAYLKDNNLNWVEDSTNELTIYARNKIRSHVMPVLEQINGEAQKKIVSAAMAVSEDCEYLDEIAKEYENRILTEQGLDANVFCDANAPIRRRVAYSIMKKSGVKEITAAKLEDFTRLCRGDNGKTLDIGSDSFFEKARGYVKAVKKQHKGDFSAVVEPGGIIEEKNWLIKVKIVDKPPKKRDNNTAVFDAEKLAGPFAVRMRKTGDRMNVLGMGKSKRLSDIFSNAKVAPSKRDEIPLVEKDGSILFLCGLRQSSDFAVQKETRSFLIFEYITKEW